MKVEATNLMKALTGKPLVLYCLEEHPNLEFRQLVRLLSYATMQSIDKTAAYLERIAKGQELITYYPAFDNESKVDGKEFIGSIPDGRLYIG